MAAASALANVCRDLIRERSVITALLGPVLCANPAWDMLLDLYLANCEGRDSYQWQLVVAANIPVSSAYQKIRALVDQGHMIRSDEDRDHRRIRVRLTPGTARMLDQIMERLALQHRGAK